MDEQNIILSGAPVEVSSFDTYKLATFMISILDEFDLSGRMIPKSAGEAFHSTIRGFPIVAKLIYDYRNNPSDFGGHELIIVRDKDGNQRAKFNTVAIGSVINSWIEDRIVEGYAGTKSCIMIQAKLWTSRCPEYFTVLDKLWATNNVKSSWEIKTDKVEVDTMGRKILRAFSFIGNALLGSNVAPAVNGAGIYEYAEADSNIEQELSQALLKDISQLNDLSKTQSLQDIKEEQGGDTLASETEEKQVQEVSENAEVEAQESPIVENTEEKEPEAETVTEEATISEVEKAEEKIEETVEEAKCGGAKKKETEKAEEVTETDKTKIAELSEALIEANKQISALTAEIETLKPFKEEIDRIATEKAEAEKAIKVAELKAYALESERITAEEIESDETIKASIEALDKAAISTIIAERLIQSMKENKKNDTQVVSASAETIDINNDVVEGRSIISVYLNS